MIKQICIAWLAYELTKDAIWLAIVMFSRELAAFITSPFAGVLADRLNKYKIVILSNIILLANTIILSFLTLENWITVPSMIIIQLVYGSTSGLEIPTRQAFVTELIKNKNNLSNAISLNSTIFNVARVLGYSIGGILISKIGVGYCFIIYAILLIIVLIIFQFIRYRPLPNTEQREFTKDIREGFVYAYQKVSIQTLLLFMTGVTLFGLSYEILMPIFANEILSEGSETFGYLMSMIGLGSIIGALFIANRKNLLGLEKILLTGVSIFGIFLIFFAFSTNFYLSMCLLLIVGIGRVSIFTVFNTLVQSITDEEKRGRVLGLYIMLFMASKTVGNLLMGFLAETFSASIAIFISGLACIIIIILLLPRFRYVSKDVKTVYEESLVQET